MQNDRITLKDLSIFTSDGSGGVFDLLDRTTTQYGRDVLRKHIHNPPDTPGQLAATQDAVKFWAVNQQLWPSVISNGTLVMLDKFFESADHVSSPPTGITLVMSAFFQKIFNRNQYFFTKFSISHLSDFLKGCMQLTAIAAQQQLPAMLQREMDSINDELKHRLTERVVNIPKDAKFAELSELNYLARREMKSMVYRLMASYARLDAWQSMAKATVEHKWVFPELQPELPIRLDAVQLYHPLLPTPVPYNITFDNNRNFLVLTGANMSGKTTFMRALGVSALLAHLGMGVPAKSLTISFMQGIITNMHVEDNILKGESYFFAEVQRMKQTAEKLLHDKPHLVLMDELFKGTNVHDACECTKGVMEGLLNHRSHLMLLSTHLYEVAHQFSKTNEILFAYFVTDMAADGNYHFTYELKQGISNDRIGYRILQKEGVIALLQQSNK